MAVLLLKGKFGPNHAPQDATGLVFNDVHPCDFAASWIEELSSLLRTERALPYAPPPCAGLFDDVECSPTPAFAVDWIEQLYNEGVTAGCGANPLTYCPSNAVTRGQMAVFLVKTSTSPDCQVEARS